MASETIEPSSLRMNGSQPCANSLGSISKCASVTPGPRLARTRHHFLRQHGCHRHWAVFAPNHDDAGLSHVPSALAISIEIVSNLSVRGNANVLVENRSPDFRRPPDIAVVHD